MKTSKIILYVFTAFALISLYSAVSAESFPEKTGYVIDSRGNVIKDTYRECVRTGYWTPAMAIEECDPDLVRKEARVAEPMPATPAPAAPMTTPAPVAPAAPLAAAVVPAAAPVAASFNAETLFDFDRAEVKPEGQKILDDKIVSGMKMQPDGTMLVITGHADRIGTDAYNQNLSERRANAVKAYLMQRGIPTDRMRASGRGESESNPGANTRQVCKDNMSRARLIACLQPDRRVTVESQARMSAR